MDETYNINVYIIQCYYKIREKRCYTWTETLMVILVETWTEMVM